MPREDFTQTFRELISQRTLFAPVSRLNNCPVYSEKQKKADRARQELLSGKNAKEVEAYEALRNECEVMMYDELYLQGLKDGLVMASLLTGKKSLASVLRTEER